MKYAQVTRFIQKKLMISGFFEPAADRLQRSATQPGTFQVRGKVGGKLPVAWRLSDQNGDTMGCQRKMVIKLEYHQIYNQYQPIYSPKCEMTLEVKRILRFFVEDKV